jgi:hypothetical protein
MLTSLEGFKTFVLELKVGHEAALKGFKETREVYEGSIKALLRLY